MIEGSAEQPPLAELSDMISRSSNLDYRFDVRPPLVTAAGV